MTRAKELWRQSAMINDPHSFNRKIARQLFKPDFVSIASEQEMYQMLIDMSTLDAPTLMPAGSCVQVDLSDRPHYYNDFISNQRGSRRDWFDLSPKK